MPSRTENAALAVLVQSMVASEISGVLFTANPLTGLLSESVIDATFGLGEALVSGQVEPDHFVVDSLSGVIKSVTLGSKKTSTRLRVGGGVESLPETAAGLQQTLSEAQVNLLVLAGQQIQKEVGLPQDIEWAFTGDDLFILQSRPITSLFPVPQVSLDPLIVWFSFGAVQGLVGPLTPLGQEAIQRVVLGMGKKLGVRISFDEQNIFVVAGERMWVRISDLIRNPLGNRVFGGFLGFIEPSVRQILLSLVDDPRQGVGQGRIRFSTLRRLLKLFLPVIPQVVRTVLRPADARQRFDNILESYLQTVHINPGSDRFERLANFAAFMEGQGGLADAMPTLVPRFITIFGPAIASLNLIGHLLPRKDAGDHGFSMLALEVTRGLPRNVTTEMDLELWETASRIRADSASAQIFRTLDDQALVSHYRAGSLPPAAQTAVKRFIDKYGMRGLGEFDLGQPRWRENPAPVMNTLKSYLQIEPEFAPDVLFARGAKAAEEAIERLAGEFRHQPGGRIKERILRVCSPPCSPADGCPRKPKILGNSRHGDCAQFPARSWGRVHRSGNYRQPG